MPFIDDDEDVIYLNKLANTVTRSQLEEEDGPSIVETAEAYFRQENIIGSFVNRQPDCQTALMIALLILLIPLR